MSAWPPWMMESTKLRTASSANESFGSFGLHSSLAMRRGVACNPGNLLAET